MQRVLTGLILSLLAGGCTVAADARQGLTASVESGTRRWISHWEL